ncbi:MAG: MBL fold metallo-hydrolase [Firmicutes bacterium]|nr:MBL fold metallo-hydrolase [Bacillota bacterium]
MEKTQQYLYSKPQKRFTTLVVSLTIVSVVVLSVGGVLLWNFIVSRGAFTFKGWQYGKLQVAFVDVGQGDCIIIRFPDGRSMIIDGGERGRGGGFRGAYSSVVSRFARGMGIERFDYMMLTHPSSDHHGGLIQVMRDFEVGTFIVPNVPNEQPFYGPSVSYADFLLYMQKQIDTGGARKYYSVRGLHISSAEVYALDSVGALSERAYERASAEVMGGALTHLSTCNLVQKDKQRENFYFTVLSPLYITDYARVRTNARITYGEISLNDSSAVAVLQFLDRRFLFTGDLEMRGEYALIEHSAGYNFVGGGFRRPYRSLFNNIDVLKLAHQGSFTSTHDVFLEVVAPRNRAMFAVAQAGIDNQFGHPHQVVFDRLARHGVSHTDIFRTDLDGSVVFTVYCTGNTYTGAMRVETENQRRGDFTVVQFRFYYVGRKLS